MAALEAALADAAFYFRHGNPEKDYMGDEQGLAAHKAKVERWQALRDKLGSL